MDSLRIRYEKGSINSYEYIEKLEAENKAYKISSKIDNKELEKVWAENKKLKAENKKLKSKNISYMIQNKNSTSKIIEFLKELSELGAEVEKLIEENWILKDPNVVRVPKVMSEEDEKALWNLNGDIYSYEWPSFIKYFTTKGER